MHSMYSIFNSFTYTEFPLQMSCNFKHTCIELIYELIYTIVIRSRRIFCALIGILLSRRKMETSDVILILCLVK